jgi:hypothetical protein
MASMSDDLTVLEERFNLRLAAELADVRTEMRTGFADLRAEIADLRGELRTDFEAKLRSQTWAMVTTLVSMSGLVFAIARFT